MWDMIYNIVQLIFHRTLEIKDWISECRRLNALFPNPPVEFDSCITLLHYAGFRMNHVLLWTSDNLHEETGNHARRADSTYQLHINIGPNHCLGFSISLRFCSLGTSRQCEREISILLSEHLSFQENISFVKHCIFLSRIRVEEIHKYFLKSLVSLQFFHVVHIKNENYFLSGTESIYFFFY